MGFLTDVGPNTAVAGLLNLAEAGRQVGPLWRALGKGKGRETAQMRVSVLLFSLLAEAQYKQA